MSERRMPAAATGPYVDYIDTLIALKQPVRAFDTLEQSRARGLRTMLAERDLVLDADLGPELVEARKRLAEGSTTRRRSRYRR